MALRQIHWFLQLYVINYCTPNTIARAVPCPSLAWTVEEILFTSHDALLPMEYYLQVGKLVVTDKKPKMQGTWISSV